MRHIEDDHQKALFDWAKRTKVRASSTYSFMLSEVMFAIPNGGKRNVKEAARMKAQGVKAGVSDIFIPIAIQDKVGFFLEMKRPIVKGQAKPTTSKAQKEWLDKMCALCFKAEIAYGFDDAKNQITNYLKCGKIQHENIRTDA